MKYLAYNPLSNNKIENSFVTNAKNTKEYEIINLLEKPFNEIIKLLKESDELYICGGDGTLNHFINEVDCDNITNNVYLVKSGSGNDFINDIDPKQDIVLLNPYIKNLPTVYVNDIEKKFINGIGFGIDGYCCEVGDKLKETQTKEINYTSIAIKGLLFHFKKVNAKVTVDGKTTYHKNVWLTPTMKGRFYGGGMMIAPNQDRSEKGTVTTVVYKTRSKLKALIVFPSIFKGEHIKKTKMVNVFKGNTVTVEFDKKTALQIDGETVKDVLKYTVRG